MPCITDLNAYMYIFKFIDISIQWVFDRKQQEFHGTKRSSLLEKWYFMAYHTGFPWNTLCQDDHQSKGRKLILKCFWWHLDIALDFDIICIYVTVNLNHQGHTPVPSTVKVNLLQNSISSGFNTTLRSDHFWSLHLTLTLISKGL